jgi:hypothetical protein
LAIAVSWKEGYVLFILALYPKYPGGFGMSASTFYTNSPLLDA